MWTNRTLLVAVAVWAAAVAPSSVQPLEMVLLHANDMHSRCDETDAYCNECREQDVVQNKCYGGFARVAEAVKREKAKADELNLPSLFVVAGDTYQGTPYFSFFKWKPIVEIINKLKPDVTTLGNHEFDDGVEGLMPYLSHTTSIPVVVSNMDLTKEPELKKFIHTSYVMTLNGTKVGFVGYLTPDTKFLAQTDGVQLLDEIEALKNESKRLRDQGVNIIIGLGHSGIERDINIAVQVEDIDLIVGGHSHTFLYTGEPPDIDKPWGPYPLLINSTNGKVIPVLHAYANTKYLGKVNIRFDSAGNLLEINGSPILLDYKIEKDREMEALVNQWKLKIVEKTSVKVGYTVVELISSTCHVSECNIGNLIADAFVFYNRQNTNLSDGQWTDAPIGIISAGGIRSSINVTGQGGDISLGQILTVLPYINRLVKLTIPGSSLLEAFETSVFDYDPIRGSNSFLQVSGALVEYDLTRHPGNRVLRLLLRCRDCQVPKYEPVILNANYTLIMADYIAMGGDKFTSFTKEPREIQDMGVKDYIATAEYMKMISPINIGIENRISFTVNNDSETMSGATNSINRP